MATTTPKARTAEEIEAENAALKAQLQAKPKPKQDNSNAPAMLNLGVTSDGEPLMVGGAPHRAFKTGSLGYQLFGKTWIAGVQYQVNLLIVEIDSKPSK